MKSIVGLLGGVLIDADAAAAHLMHHRQQVDFQPIGVARSFPLDDRREHFGQLRAFAPHRSRRRGRHSAPAIARCRIWHWIFLLILKPAALHASSSSSGVLAGQTVALADCVEL